MAEIAALLADLTSGNDEQAESAALALAAHGLPALLVLKELIQSEAVDHRWWAIRALAQFPPAEDVTRELVAALDDEAGEVRQCAVMALWHHPDLQAIEPLSRMLSDPDTMTAKLVCNALTLVGSAAVPALIAVLQTGSRTARFEATRALAEIKDPQAIPVLLKALEQDSALMQYWATCGLDKLGLGMLYIKPE
jgi:HEAT repeat protein